jgi:hypothetical protein
MSEFDSPSDIERFNKIMKQFRQEDAAKGRRVGASESR